MSSKTSSRSTLTTVPSTMSPSLKYLMVSSIAARKASSDPMSLTATCGVVEVASVLLVMCRLAPVRTWKSYGLCAEGRYPPCRRPEWNAVAAASVNRTVVADLTEREPAPSEARAGPQRSDQDMGPIPRGQSARGGRDQYVRARALYCLAIRSSTVFGNVTVFGSPSEV